MKKLLIAALFVLCGPLSSAQVVLELFRYELDSTTYVYPQLCSGVTSASPGACPGSGNPTSKLVTTSGASSATLTSVNTDAPFAGMAVGDALVLQSQDATSTLLSEPVTRRADAVASVNSITLSSAVIVPTAGVTFVWSRLVAGTGAATDGWFPMPESASSQINISFDQANVTGGIDYKIECRQCVNAYCTTPNIIAGPTNVASFPAAARASITNERWSQCRVGLKIGTADDGGDLTTNMEQISVTARAVR